MQLPSVRTAIVALSTLSLSLPTKSLRHAVDLVSHSHYPTDGSSGAAFTGLLYEPQQASKVNLGGRIRFSYDASVRPVPHLSL
jgi:hypothetical protein